MYLSNFCLGEVTIFAELSQGVYAVLDAKLYAQLIHPQLNETEVDTVKYYLHDDGLDDDLNSLDGVYTTTVTPPQDGIDFVIKVFAIGEGSASYVSRNHYVGFGARTIMDNRRGEVQVDRYRRDVDDVKYSEELLKTGKHDIPPLDTRFISFYNMDLESHYKVEINGYFRDRAVTLRVPVINMDYFCCDKILLQNQSRINFKNDLTNDKIVIKIR